jgi:8-oxo-dGTP pyrophosphatase MutT (NUDIX family)
MWAAIYDKLKHEFQPINCTHDWQSTDKLTYNNFPHCDLALSPDTRLTKCAILILLFRHERQFHVLLTIRSHHLKSFKGEICFPGGKFDQSTDKSFTDTALREAHEEIGLRRENVEIVCELCPFISPAGHYIAPVVGLIKHEALMDRFDVSENTMDVVADLKPNPDEVDSIFWMPVSYVLESNYSSDRIATFKHPIRSNQHLREILEVIQMDGGSSVKDTNGLKIEFYDRMLINFEADLFPRNVASATYPFIYGINATLLLAVCILVQEESDTANMFEINLNGMAVNKKTLVSYFKFFRFCSYVLLKSGSDVVKSKKIKSNL